jgi:hypothetical protein
VQHTIWALLTIQIIFKSAFMKISLTLTFITFAICAHAQTDTSNQKTSFTRDDYSVQYPKTWRLDTSKLMGTEFFILASLESETDKFSENVNLIIQDLGGQDVSLEMYKELTDKQLTEMLTDGKVFESAVVTTDKGSYYKAIYAMTQGKFRLKTTSICVIKDGKAYLGTFSSEFDKYDNYKKVGEEILDSLLSNLH